ncbi:MAG: HU family DNA-binding protein [Thermodesulfobacteriota bacterium]
MYRKELVEELAVDGRSKKGIREVLARLEFVVTDALVHGKAVTLPGLGKFVSIESKPRDGRNPRTGKKLKIPGKLKVRFRPAKQLRDAVGRVSPAPASKE